MRAEEVSAQHVEAIGIQLNLVFRQMFPKKIPHQLASSPARLRITIVERLWMCGFQQVVELGTIRVGQTNEMARRVHTGRAGEKTVSALLAKVLLSLRPRLLAEPLSRDRRGEVNDSLSLMTRFAQHYVSFKRDALLPIMLER